MLLAVLTKEIRFTDFEGQTHTYPKGTTVCIDREASTALVLDIWFDVSQDEYTEVSKWN